MKNLRGIMPTANQSLMVQDTGLSNYLREVNRYPLLTVQEERFLLQKWVTQRDIGSVRQLIVTHLRFVIKIAKEFSGYGLAQADLIQEGNLGLMKAVQRFDLKFEVRLATFAVYWIKSAIYNYVINNWQLVKIATTKSQRKLFFKKHELLQLAAKGTPPAQQMQALASASARLAIPIEEIKGMQNRLLNQEISIDHSATPKHDSKFDYNGGRSLSKHSSALPDHSADFAKQFEETQWKDHLVNRMKQAYAQLDPRSQAILKHRWLEEPRPTLQTLAKQYGVSAERIRQLESKAFSAFKAACLLESNQTAMASQKLLPSVCAL